MQRELYGGAMVATFDPRFVDISDFRQVPDHQEAFQDANADQSVTFEVLEYLPEHADADIASYHWKQLAEDNEATQVGDVQGSVLPGEEWLPALHGTAFTVSRAVGEQSITKHNEEAANRIRLECFVVRLPEYTTDLLISVNTPVEIHPQSTSAHAAEDAHLGDGNNTAVRQVLESFNIVDYALFC